MKKLKFALLLSLFANWSFAQLVNDGATITIKNGATLFVETDVQNNTTGTITVETGGTLEVQGSFTNAATAMIDVQGTGKLKFTGASNSNLTTNTDPIRNLEVSKSNSTVTLVDNLTITNNLDFASAGSSKLVLGANTAILNSGATITGNDADEYVNASGAGFLQKNYADGALAASAFTFPVGDATNYSPLATAVTGTAASANLKVSVVDLANPNGHPNKPSEADAFLSRYWNVDQTNITGYSNALTGTYVDAADRNGTAALIKGASYNNSAPNNWKFTAASNNVGTPSVSGTTSFASADFTGLNALNAIDITANLQGATTTGGGMTAFLQNYFGGNTGLLPTTSPYGAPTTTYAAINNPAGAAGSVTDWVKVQVREVSNPAIVKETRSLLLKPTGHIVDAAGRIPYFKESTTPVHIIVQHRNHQAVMSNSISSFTGTEQTYDFTTALSQAFNSGGDPAQLVLKNAKWTIPSGDVNLDLSVDATDVGQTKSAASLGIFDEYVNTDVNLDGSVDAVDLGIVKLAAAIGYYSSLINY